MATKALLVACLVSSAFAATYGPRDMVVHESRANIPEGFVDDGPANGTTVINLRAALVQNDIAGLEQELYAVSTPGSQRYGQYLTQAEVNLMYSSFPPVLAHMS